MILAAVVLSLLVINYYYFTDKLESYLDDDKEISNKEIPLILFHGFTPTYSTRIADFLLDDLQFKISEDLEYADRGIYRNDKDCSDIISSKKPIIIRASYLNNLEPGTIEEYTKNTGKIISKILYCTGSEKADIITHSMGGIVLRNYITEYGRNNIRNLIMIASPKNSSGIYNIDEIAEFIFKNIEIGLEVDFIELLQNDLFDSDDIKKQKDSSVNFYTIGGIVDKKGDRIILYNNTKLGWEKEHKKVECNHIDIKKPDRCPESYEFIRNIILGKIGSS